uniref:Uncharacterized protein n=1 Tax=Amphimedon queenslandica TaxID=400682 RepID=A0A1X7VPJ8_AMPQE
MTTTMIVVLEASLSRVVRGVVSHHRRKRKVRTLKSNLVTTVPDDNNFLRHCDE